MRRSDLKERIAELRKQYEEGSITHEAALESLARLKKIKEKYYAT